MRKRISSPPRSANFHTIPSILKPSVLWSHWCARSIFPYDSVYFKAVDDPREFPDPHHVFPYDSVYFKAFMKLHPFHGMVENFHTIPSILKHDALLERIFDGEEYAQFPYDSVYFKALLHLLHLYHHLYISIRFRLF